MSSPGEQSSQPFVRDDLTWLGYLLIGNYCYLLAAQGPFMPFLREELHLNYQVSAYHFSAWAFGVLLAGLTGDRAMRMFSRPRVIWVCATVLSCAITLLITAHVPALTICGAFFAGISGSIMGQTINTVLSDRFSAQRALAITEANIAASIACSLAPLAISCFARTNFGWRAALVVPIFLFAVEAILFRKAMQKVPPMHEGVHNKGRLPAAYWAFWTVVLFSVAAEWSIIFWSCEFLERMLGLAKADASAAVTSFLSAMLIGRIIGSRLTRIMSISILLPLASLVLMGGFLLFWLPRYAPLNIAGLFIAGLGMANFYPLTLSAAISTAPEQASAATARMSVGTGTAILCAPLILGWVADRSDISHAYGVVAVLLLIAGSMVFFADWLCKRHHRKLAEEKAKAMRSAGHIA
jgi:MFS family permease